MCWGKTAVEAKTASNSAAVSRIDMLQQYVADIDAGRVEFTSERKDLEKEIEELMGDLELAKSTRDQERKDFLVAMDEIQKAENALHDAIDVLESATKNHTEGVLLARRSSLNVGFAQRAKEAAALNFAVDLGNRYLSKGDAVFLRRLLTGEVPTHDWKKLNRKATFKMKYKARSTGIQETLSKLLATFEKNGDEAQDREDKAEETYGTLKAAKEDQLNKAQDSLAKMDSEMGARGMSKVDAEAEIGNLQQQVTTDTQFISDTNKAMETKKKEWKQRSTLRADEIKAISQAVSILYNDDAKDNFKKSSASQGFFFLQTSQQSAAVARVSVQLQQLAKETRDKQLSALLASVKAGQFDQVLAAIDKIVGNLKNQQDEDLSNKEDCEKTRMEDVRDAMVAGRAMDDLTDTITRLQSEIKDLNTELDTTNADLAAVRKELAEATKIREDEAADWKVSDAEDQQASETVGEAIVVLRDFYKDNNLMFAQQQQQQPASPPPPTWEGGYAGKTGEASGILQILTICQEDIDKDRQTAKDAEEKAQAAYDKLKANLEQDEQDLLGHISTLEGQIGSKETDVTTNEGERNTKSGELKSTMEKIDGANMGCEYITVNYPLRVKNRQIEIDGLLKAKAILSGAEFTKPADENREIKPGDALLQRLRRH
jgi:hypothetical protein